MIGYAFKQKKTFAQYLVNYMRNSPMGNIVPWEYSPMGNIVPWEYSPMDNIVSYDSTYDFKEIFLKKRHRTKRLKKEQNELEYVILDFSF